MLSYIIHIIYYNYNIYCHTLYYHIILYMYKWRGITVAQPLPKGIHRVIKGVGLGLTVLHNFLNVKEGPTSGLTNMAYFV